MRECYLQTYTNGKLILEVAIDAPLEYRSRCNKNYNSSGMGELLNSIPCSLNGTPTDKPEMNKANPTNFIRTRAVGKFVQ